MSRLDWWLLVGLALLTTCGDAAAQAEKAKRLNATVSWLGNSYPGAKDWVQQDIHSIFVAGDGSVFTNVGWDEGGGQACVFRDGELVARAGHTHGWGQEGGEAIAVNAQYVYIAQSMHNEGGGLSDARTWPAKGKAWFGVSRRTRADLSKPAAFPGGKGGQGDTLRECFLPIVEVDDKTKADLMGLVADDRRVYASCPHENRIRVFDAETMQPMADWQIERPGPLALDREGKLWVLQAGDPTQPRHVFRTDLDSQRILQEIPFPAGTVPTAIAIDARDRLLVADAGPDQQILIYANILQVPRRVGTFGAKGGIYSGTPGAVGPLKFNDPRGVGVDAAGNIYVASDGQSGGGGAVLESYRPDGTLNWQRLGLEFVDMADVDPAADTDIYTKEEHFRADYAQSSGKEFTYQGYTIQRFKYPEDPRLHIWSAGAWVQRIKGQRFLFVTEMNAGYLQVFRFDHEHEGEVAIPSGLFSQRHLKTDKNDGWPPQQPERGEWIWRDANGDGRFSSAEYQRRGDADAPAAQGWCVDASGNVWQATETAGIRMFPLSGLDSRGNPIWDYSTMKVFPKPAELEQVKRIRYDAQQDVMYLGGTTAEHKNQHWKPMGPVLCRYDRWSTDQARLSWKIIAPYAKGSEGHSSCEPMGFDVAGDYVFLPYTGAAKETGFLTGHVEVFRADDGARVGFMEPSADVGEIGLQDIRECLRAYRRADGEYVIFMEEDFKAKILMYRWKP